MNLREKLFRETGCLASLASKWKAGGGNNSNRPGQRTHSTNYMIFGSETIFLFILIETYTFILAATRRNSVLIRGQIYM